MRSPTAAEVDQLVRLYLRVSSQLTTARRRYADPNLLVHLNDLVTRANAQVHGTRTSSWAALRDAALITFPAAVWHARRQIGVAAAVFLGAWAITAVWVANSPAVLDVAIPPEVRAAYLAEDFENYYSSQPAAAFASQLFTNNARVGILAFALGPFLGLPTLLLLAYNGLNVGVANGAFASVGQQRLFWGLILPHGFLELTAIMVAGGSGLELGWSIVSPGARTRADALAETGRRAVVIVMGLVPTFLLAALLESWVTPSDLPTALRVGTGFVVWVAWLVWAFGIGRQAAADGWTGALGERRGLTGVAA